jgi:hypothetical protein
LLEELSPRTLPAAGVTTNALGVVLIQGTSADDTVHVTRTEETVIVDFNGQAKEIAAGRARMIVFHGRSGNDTFINETDIRSVAFGGAGDDSLTGGLGADQLIGQDGDDALAGGDNRDNLEGGRGADDLSGGDGRDTLRGGPGDDDLNGDDGPDRLDGGLGDDDLDGGLDDDRLNGQQGDDLADGGDGDDVIQGDAGFDSLFGSAGDDSIFGGQGQDECHGGQGNDDVQGGQDDDDLFGDEGDDDLHGGHGQDDLDGGDDDDDLDGGDGDDHLVDHQGQNRHRGGRGRDHFEDDGDDEIIGDDDDIAGDNGSGDVTPNPDLVTQEVENNNRESTATAFVFNDVGLAQLAGTSLGPDDKDYFKFTAPRSGTLQIKVTNDGKPVQLEMENVQEETLLETEPGDGVHSGSVAVVEGETYFLRLRAKPIGPAAYLVDLTLV